VRRAAERVGETARNFVENVCAGERTRYMLRMLRPGLIFYIATVKRLVTVACEDWVGRIVACCKGN
jgi:hypothetical protein